MTGEVDLARAEVPAGGLVSAGRPECVVNGPGFLERVVMTAGH